MGKISARLCVGLFGLAALATSTVHAGVFINEFHYDNEGTDSNEKVEVIAPAGTSLSGWTVVLYNGSSGARYATLNLSGTIANQCGGYGTAVVAATGMQNGSPDGLALVNASGAVVQLLGYEGSFTASDGPAAGMASTPVPQSETTSTPVGYSLQLSGNKPYGNCTSSCTEYTTQNHAGAGGGGGVFPGNSNWASSSIWQTWRKLKGNVARALLYMDVRYEGGVHGVTGAAEPDLRLTDNAGLIRTTSGNFSVAYMGLLSVLLQWHAEDPVTEAERLRNDAVHSYQGNRNPFVDHPEWVACVYQNICN